jgi:hypothetical protein
LGHTCATSLTRARRGRTLWPIASVDDFSRRLGTAWVLPTGALLTKYDNSRRGIHKTMPAEFLLRDVKASLGTARNDRWLPPACTAGVGRGLRASETMSYDGDDHGNKRHWHPRKRSGIATRLEHCARDPSARPPYQCNTSVERNFNSIPTCFSGAFSMR